MGLLAILSGGSVLSVTPANAASEPPISSIKLITQRPNIPPFKEAAPGERLGLWLGGGVFNGERAYKEAMKLFEKYPSLAAFYPTPRKREEFGASAREAFNRQVGTVDNIRDAIYGVEVLTHHMGSLILDRALVSQGITSITRRKAWSDSLKKQVHSCISQSKSFLNGALPCSDIFSEGLPANIGLAALYEITDQKLVRLVNDPAALLSKIDQEYRSCIKKQHLDADAVEPCTRKSMKTAVTETVMEQVTQTLRPEFKNPKRLNTLIAELKTSFGKCAELALVTKRTDEPGTRACIDTLVVDAGTRTVRERITAEPAVAEYYPKAASRLALSKTQETSFARCVAEQQKQNKRDEEGVLLIEPCRNLVTNSVTYTIVLNKFKEAARDSLTPKNPENPKEVAAIGAARAAAVSAAQTSLDRCWSKYQNSGAKEACLRTGVNRIASALAASALDQQVDERILKTDPELKRSLLKPFQACVNAQVRGNVSEDNALNTKINICVGPLRRDASLAVADFEVRDQLNGEVPDQVMEDLVKKLVKNDFASCLGASPDENTGKKCVATLEREAAKEIGSVRFPLEMWKLLPITDNEQQAQEFADKLARESEIIVTEFRGCIDKHVRLDTSKTSEKRIDICTKRAVQDIAIFIANLQVDSKIADFYGNNVKGLEELKKILIKDLSACMEAKNNLEFSDYVRQVTVCGDLTSERAILYIARDQLQRVLRKIERSEILEHGPVPESRLKEVTTCPDGTESAVELITKIEELKSSMDEILASYVNYDLKLAKKDVLNLLSKVNQELASTPSLETRKRVLQWLSKDTAVVTQVLKAVVRDQIKEGFEALPAHERPAPEVIVQVTSNQALDQIFENPKGKALVDKLIKGLLHPILVNNEPLQSPEIKLVQTQLTSEIKDLLVAAPQFGQTLADGYTQPELDKRSHLERGTVRMVQFFKGSFHTAFSKDALNWEKIKMTQKGQKAETYIIENLVRPSVTGQSLSAEEKTRRRNEAARLVRSALLAKR